MGNVLHTQRLVRAARLNDDNRNDYVSSVLQLVEQRPALLRAKSRALGGTLWHWAAATGDILLLEGLIRFITRTTSGAEVQQDLCQLLNQGYNLDTTPLMLACRHGHAEAVCLLLQHGANPHLTDRRGGNTCLHIAAYAGHASVIKVVLDTPATYPLLLETGVANVPGVHDLQQQQQQQQQQVPALQQEQQQQQQQQVPAVEQEQGATLLLDKGNLYGLTALHIAVCKGRAEAVDVLLEAGASLLSSSQFPTEVGGMYLPRRTTPLHAAVHARDLQRVAALLTVHEQRYGGTAAGRANDPRWLPNGNGQLPFHLARSMHLPGSFCELLYPLTSLREHLQQWQQPEQGLLGLQQGMPMQQHLCRSLQELAGIALREALLSQLHCVAAAVGAGSRSGDQQLQQKQQQPEANESAEALNAAAAELFLKLQDSVMVCVSITPAERLCMKLRAQHDRQQVPTTGGKQLPYVLQLSQQSLLDVVRFYILCHGVCDPGDPTSCWFADACNICTTAASFSTGTAPGKQPGNSLVPSSGTQYDQTSMSNCQAYHSPGKVSLTGCDGRPCSSSSSSSPAAPKLDDCSNSGGINGSTTADSYNWLVQDLHCSFMPASQCSQLPGAALLDHSRLVPLLQSMKSSCAARWSALQGGGSWREACGICLEEEQGLLLRLKPCKHVLCLTCVEVLVGLVSSKPALCPFCRAAIAGVHVHVGEQGAGVEAQHALVGDVLQA